MKIQSAVMMNRQLAKESRLLDSEQVRVKQRKGYAILPMRIDDGVPADCVYVPGGIEAVNRLGAAYGKIDLEKVS